MDVAKLTPAPWVLGGDLNINGVWWPDEASDFIRLARQAFDVMMSDLKLNPEWYGDGWGVDSGVIQLPRELEKMRWSDPYTALVEGMAWYKANVEAK